MMVYVIVRYGECEEAIFNPFCRTKNLLQSIRQKCNCTHDVDIELSDESGNIKFLRDCPNRYANEYLGERETLVLLRVENISGSTDTYVPLLQDDDYVNEEFIARLSGKNFSNSKRAKSNTRRHKQEQTQTDRTNNNKQEKLKSAKNDKRSKSRNGK